MKVISCGCIIIYDNKILVGRPNTRTIMYNLPKGIMEDTDISYFDTARREVLEETNIDIETNCKMIEDIGLNTYLKDKDLYLYLVKLKTKPEVECKSFYTDPICGIQYPEMVDFKWIDLMEYKMIFSYPLQKIFATNFKKIQNFLNKT